MTFKKNGYFIIRNFLDQEFVNFINQYFFTRINGGHAKIGDSQAPNSYVFYGDPLMDTILNKSTKSLSEISEFSLIPTYSYTRLYGKGDELKIHRDRYSCQISATLSLGFSNDEKINSIFFSKNIDKSDAIQVDLNPGDLCLYLGCELYHWRESFKHNWYLQSFLHYVDANGDYKDQIFDGRKNLGTFEM